MFTVFSLLFGKLFGVSAAAKLTSGKFYKGLFAVILIAVVGFFVWKTYNHFATLGERNVALQIKVVDLEKELKQTKDELELSNSSGKVDVASVGELCKKHDEADTKLEEVTSSKEGKIAAVKKKFKDSAKKPEVPVTTPTVNTPPTKDSPVSVAPQLTEEQEIAAVQIDSLWEVFCGADVLSHGNEQCKQGTKT